MQTVMGAVKLVVRWGLMGLGALYLMRWCMPLVRGSLVDGVMTLHLYSTWHQPASAFWWTPMGVAATGQGTRGSGNCGRRVVGVVGGRNI